MGGKTPAWSGGWNVKRVGANVGLAVGAASASTALTSTLPVAELSLDLSLVAPVASTGVASVA